jgi:hypothetical protein
VLKMKTRDSILGMLLMLDMLCLPSHGNAQNIPKTDDDYVRVTFKKAINPAFTDDFARKWVRFKARYMTQIEVVMDLPNEYQKYVRIMVGDTGDRSAATRDVVIPKEKSDVVFELQRGENVELFAYAVPVTRTSRISGSSQNMLLFVVQKIARLKNE